MDLARNRLPRLDNWPWVKIQIVPRVSIPIPTQIDKNGWWCTCPKMALVGPTATFARRSAVALRLQVQTYKPRSSNASEAHVGRLRGMQLLQAVHHVSQGLPKLLHRAARPPQQTSICRNRKAAGKRPRPAGSNL